MSTTLKSRIDKWLRELGHTPVEQNDPAVSWHLTLDYPAHTPHQLHVVSPATQPDRIVIVSGTEIAHQHQEAFGKLDDDGKETFIWEFRNTINSVHVDFQIDGVKSNLECPSRFQIMATRYEDGLTKDSFAFSLGAVFKTELAAVGVVQRHLEPRSYGSGGRFDFKRIGL